MTSANHIPPPDQPARDAIRTDLATSILVEASAGTGKTTSMIGRMIELIRSGMAIEHIVAITFTKKAAAELQGRFYKALQDSAREDGLTPPERDRFSRAVSQIDRCTIGTIHSFCGKLLRERPIEAGVGMNFSELDDESDLPLRHQGWDNFVDECYAGDGDLPERLDETGVGFADLRDAFVKSCNYSDVEQWPVDDVTLPDGEELAAALNAFRHRIRQIEPLLVDVHAGNDTLLEVYLNPPKTAHLQLADRADHRREFFELLESLPAEPKKVNRNWPGAKDQAEDEHERWREFYTAHIEPLVQRLRACRYRMAMDMFASAREQYDALRRRANALNFQDLLLAAANLLRKHPAVRAQFRQQIRALLVDEFQDTDPIQAEIMMLLTASDPAENDFRRCTPRPGSLFVVGDPKQSIYRFRRADIQTYNFVKERIQSSGGRVLRLSTNFRSCADVIGWVNAQFGPEGERFPSAVTAAQAAAETMHVGKPDRDLPARANIHGIATILDPFNGAAKNSTPSIELEAQRIAAFIAHAVESGASIVEFDPDGTPKLRSVCYGDFLILVRTKKRLATYAAALLERDLPAQVTGGAQLNEIEELDLLHRALATLAEPDNPIALVAMLRSGLFGIDDDTLLRFRRAGGTFDYRAALPATLDPATIEQFAEPFAKLRTYAAWLDAQLPPVVVAERMLDDLGLLLRAACRNGATGTLGGLARAIELLRHRQRQSFTTAALADLLAELIDQRVGFDVIPALAPCEAPIRVMNLHKAKGLEAPVVFLACSRGQIRHAPTLHIDRSGEIASGHMVLHGKAFGAGKGRLLACPMQWPDYEQAEQVFLDAEAVRLLYVAATRAGRALIVSTREKPSSTNPWNALHDALADAPPLELPANCENPPTPVSNDGETIDFDLAAATAELDARKAALTEATYCVRAAKADALARAITSDHPARHIEDRESLGAAWGTAVHELLEAQMRNPACDLHALGAQCLAASDLDESLRDAIVQTVRSVIASPLLQRARAAEECYSELPFEVAIDDGRGVEKGVIDLLFRDENGWTIVDYKTDASAKTDPDALAEKYRPQLERYAEVWQAITGQAVHRRVLLFTATGETADV